MIEIRWHGRGGQGAVTATELLAKAAVKQGLKAQAFAMFGPERRGSPVVAFTRIDKEPIEVRSHIYEPDIVVTLDPTIINIVDVSAGLKPKGTLVINSKFSPKELKKSFSNFRISAVDATSIALQRLGVPITNTVMLGALVKATKIVELSNVEKVVLERFNQINVEAVREAFDKTITLEV
ncbi:MAG: 2-oxoacid:acceptor oxidoreductase family protein [archaeon]|nr:2-oxoacid:acceptor oxidoreductase family protein [archaeon]MCP8316303.1 2-oxoacid:acceptor oxidoreductase family protein [archaeon]